MQHLMAMYSKTFAWVRRLKAADYRRRRKQAITIMALILRYRIRH